LYEATIDGRVGSSQERLQALSDRERQSAFMARFAKLPLKEKSEIWLRIQGGEDYEALLPP
jgi:hypothetical protein